MLNHSQNASISHSDLTVVHGNRTIIHTHRKHRGDFGHELENELIRKRQKAVHVNGQFQEIVDIVLNSMYEILFDSFY
ncbi:hypothetical protein GYMLUDRAFT_47492 [Collybiopsis luxurians FD-317 M1]|uniref:Uncharacterized protein n=1 Tax=Collybiopsis luxurians FD-317 M1 TaxID=944289 RepID=A0A0D0BM20_9AGAR|nr:hypothetical protein GYMLUDRAFT_47492 [Collybiopsis luxurians FD-317 M1]